jgi:hypothetical protein
MENLIEHVRLLIDDASEPYDFTDTQVEQYINKYRKAAYELPVTAEDEDYTVFNIGYKNLADFKFEDANENLIAESEYTLDVFNGVATFTAEQNQTLYATFTCHDLNNAAADIWKVRAAQARGMGAYKLGDQQLPEGKESISFCMKKYWELRQGRTFLMER